MEKITLKINGMTCHNCAKHVTEALEHVVGVNSVKVNLKKAEAVVKSEKIDLESLTAAVETAGYQVV
ncbi:hypothetical protein Hs30E_18050 [Lactococcus hodotermopsidis]|uniref:HMA domain-containing protein n=1 Tax=Pseudolactococcus hodotermopsidis TaxID=2709157 RepID=A0A6A0BFJ8_9LACT|nr:cation transporter [Lactococcus hodotermopsidis]GFH43254.1 hypothetical protein Hs30E_18050 [Lactococcus hodotermopsidis]